MSILATVVQAETLGFGSEVVLCEATDEHQSVYTLLESMGGCQGKSEMEIYKRKERTVLWDLLRQGREGRCWLKPRDWSESESSYFLMNSA
jgi:hypothetical protein